MDKLKYIKLENEDGSYSDSIPLAVDANHVDVNGNTLTNELNNKANNSSIDILQSQINGLASGSPLVASSISEMIDTSKIYVNTTDGNWYYYNGSAWIIGGVYQVSQLGDESIHEYNLSNTILSRKDNQEEITFGEIETGIINDNGTINPNATWIHYVRVNCRKGQKFIITHNMSTNNYFVAFYTADNSFISGIKGTVAQATETILVPDNTAYALIQGHNIVAPLESKIKLYTILVTVDKDDTLFENSINFIDSLMILADNNEIKDNETEGYYISYGAGTIHTLVGSQISDYIPLSIQNTSINIKCLNNVFKDGNPDGRGLAFYDINKTYISGVQYTNTNLISTTIPVNAQYIRLTLNSNKEYSIEYTDLKSIINSNINNDNLPLSKVYDTGHLANIFNNIMCIGDSLTRGALEGVTVPSSLWDNELLYSYPKQMERTLGNTVYNLGISGATTKGWYNAKGSYIENNDYKAQCYIIALGTNDISYNGSFDGDVSTDINTSDYTQNADTSVGWYGRIIQRIRTRFPDSVIFCCGIPNTRNSLETRTQANQKISAICTLLNCKFLDFQTYGVQVDDVNSWKAKYYKGGHLNVCGYKEFANMVMSYINWYIENDPQSYWKVPFCNLDLE